MCCVMPPASPLATRVRRIVSSSDVLPWSTWPITVTTGGRGTAFITGACSVSTSNASGSSSFAAFALWPISSTTIIAVSWSITWLIVTIEPSFISALMTSAAFTDILCARSATVIVSGTKISRTSGPVCTDDVAIASPLRPRGRGGRPSHRASRWPWRRHSCRRAAAARAGAPPLPGIPDPALSSRACRVARPAWRQDGATCPRVWPQRPPSRMAPRRQALSPLRRPSPRPRRARLLPRLRVPSSSCA